MGKSKELQHAPAGYVWHPIGSPRQDSSWRKQNYERLNAVYQDFKDGRAKLLSDEEVETLAEQHGWDLAAMPAELRSEVVARASGLNMTLAAHSRRRWQWFVEGRPVVVLPWGVKCGLL